MLPRAAASAGCILVFASGSLPELKEGACRLPPAPEEIAAVSPWAWLRDGLPWASTKQVSQVVDSLPVNFVEELCDEMAAYLNIGILASMYMTTDVIMMLRNQVYDGHWMLARDFVRRRGVDRRWELGLVTMLEHLYRSHAQLADDKPSAVGKRDDSPSDNADLVRVLSTFHEAIISSTGPLKTQVYLSVAFYPHAAPVKPADAVYRALKPRETSAELRAAYHSAALAIMDAELERTLLSLPCSVESCSQCIVPWAPMGVASPEGGSWGWSFNVTARRSKVQPHKRLKPRFLRRQFAAVDHVVKRAWEYLLQVGSLMGQLKGRWPVARLLARVLRKRVVPVSPLCDLWREQLLLRTQRETTPAPGEAAAGALAIYEAQPSRLWEEAGVAAFAAPLIPWPRRWDVVPLQLWPRRWDMASLWWAFFTSTWGGSQNWAVFQGGSELLLTGMSTCGRNDIILDHLRKRLRSLFATANLRVLDFAAGVGSISVGFMRYVPGVQVLAFTTGQTDSGFVEWSIIAERGVPYFEHTRAPGVDIPVPTAGFDLVYCCECAAQDFASNEHEHVLLKQFFKEVDRVLRPGGVLAISIRALAPISIRKNGLAVKLAAEAHLHLRPIKKDDMFLFFHSEGGEASAVGAGPSAEDGPGNGEQPLQLAFARALSAALLDWDAGLHTRALDANAAASQGALSRAIRDGSASHSRSATSVTHVVWGLPPGGGREKAMAKLVDCGLVGFAATCGELPLREGSFDIVAVAGLDVLAGVTCSWAGSLASVLFELDRLCREGGLVLLEMSAGDGDRLKGPAGWRHDFTLASEPGRVIKAFTKR